MAPTSSASAFLVRLERRPVAALVGDALQRAALRQALAGRGVDLRGPLQRLGEAAGADADRSCSPARRTCRARARRRRRSGSAAPAERHALFARPASSTGKLLRRRVGVRAGERHRDHGVGAEAALVGRAVEVDQPLVDLLLVGDAERAQAVADARVDVLHRLARVDRSSLRRSRSRRPPGRSRVPTASGVVPRPTITSASTVGRPRESQTWRPFTSRIFAMRRAAAARVEAAGRQCRALSSLRDSLSVRSSRYSTGDLPSTRASSSAGSSEAVALLDASEMQRPQVGRCKGVEAVRGTRRGARGTQRHLSSRWFRQKARSKAGSPYQAHSASRNTGPRGADQDVLRADVAVHQADAWCRPFASPESVRISPAGPGCALPVATR